MAMQVQCPHCRSVCQVQEAHLGFKVQCAKCGKPFITPSSPTTSGKFPAVPVAPSPTGTFPAVPLAPAAPSPAPAPSPIANAASALSGFWSGLRGLLPTTSGQPPAPARPPQTQAPPAQEDDLLEIELDGPSAKPQSRTTAPALTPSGARLEIGSATSTGRVRQRNEDSFLTQHLTLSNLDQRRELALLVVADGMGGYEAGDRASALVIRCVAATFMSVFANLLSAKEPPPLALLAEAASNAIKNANKMVYDQGQTVPGCKGMGATAAVVVIVGQNVVIGHVGDCRVYQIKDGRLVQLTKDQTLVARMVETGKLTEKEAETHPQRNEVTQAVGKHADIYPANYQTSLKTGDWLIIACDGLHAHVDGPALHGVLSDLNLTANQAAAQLVDRANQGGGTDNCTVVAVRLFVMVAQVGPGWNVLLVAGTQTQCPPLNEPGVMPAPRLRGHASTAGRSIINGNRTNSCRPGDSCGCDISSGQSTAVRSRITPRRAGSVGCESFTWVSCLSRQRVFP